MEYLIWQCQVAIESNGGILLSLFLAGLLGSVNHCAGMCGPFVVAQLNEPQRHSGEQSGGSPFKRLKGAALLPYHLGRLTTYVLLGIAGASLSQYIVGSPVQRGIAFTLLSVAGLLFLCSAVPSIKAMFTPFFTQHGNEKGQLNIVRLLGEFIGKVARPFFMKKSAGHQYLLGTLLGFIPCALVIAAVMAVVATGSPLTAAIGMTMFGIGTIPALVMVGAGARTAMAYWPQGMRQISTGIMAINGVGLMVLAGGMVT
ncbi:sulfite exporter TauE/SafE family protein [Kordiimonas aquimaris]|uniref:sulfite exporter TauE/SafE family protein n=1 Tax=Kordiimonas aquimaris TaxID=707591 RepID=UPI0021CFD7C5|nr:sulfite exporter TauE/SafE family protein [Kordiimonas aquimaris]